MEKYINYQRIEKFIKMDKEFEKNLNSLFKNLISDGLEIISYKEQIKSNIKQQGFDAVVDNTLLITMLVGKKQQVL